jgi:hypothetical protein
MVAEVLLRRAVVNAVMGKKYINCPNSVATKCHEMLRNVTIL